MKRICIIALVLLVAGCGSARTESQQATASSTATATATAAEPTLDETADSPSPSASESPRNVDFKSAATLTIDAQTADGYSGRVTFKFAPPRKIRLPDALVSPCDIAQTVPFGRPYVVVRALTFSVEVKDTTKASGFHLSDGALSAALLPRGGGAVCGAETDFPTSPDARFPLPVGKTLSGDILVYGKVSPNTPDPLATFGKVEVMVMETQKTVGQIPCEARATGNVAVSTGNKNCTALVDVSK